MNPGHPGLPGDHVLCVYRGWRREEILDPLIDLAEKPNGSLGVSENRDPGRPRPSREFAAPACWPAMKPTYRSRRMPTSCSGFRSRDNPVHSSPTAGGRCG